MSLLEDRGPQLDKYEQVFSVGLVSEGGGEGGGTLPCDLSHDEFDVTYPFPH